MNKEEKIEKKKDKVKLNLGCQWHYKEGYINLDIFPKFKPEVIHDLNKFPYPFKDNSIDEIYMGHILEHLNDFFGVMKELNRILKINGILKIEVPYVKNESAFRPQHVNHFNPYTFEMYSNALGFDKKKIELVCSGKWRKFIPFKKFLNIFLWNIYDVIYIELEKNAKCYMSHTA